MSKKINIFSSVQKSPAAEVLMDVSDKVENTGSQHVDDEETSKQIDDPVSSAFQLQLGLDNDIFATTGRK